MRLLWLLCLIAFPALAAEPKPGLWEIRVKSSVPGLTQMMALPVVKRCFTADQLKRYTQPGGMREEGCHITHTGPAAQSTFNASCQNGMEISGKADVKETSGVVYSMLTQNGFSTQSETRLTRLGDCMQGATR